jgi:hypothetical protein
MTPSRRLIAGVALILLTNLVALAGVAYNRSGAPEAILVLTQRELHPPYAWGFAGENSGVALSLQWRTLGMDGNPYETQMPYFSIGGEPEWLDQAKLSALGFDVSWPLDTGESYRHYDRMLPREVLLVLELNGPAYQQALARTRKYAAQAQALFDAGPKSKEFERRAQTAREQLNREEQDNSRLFVIDAGTDLLALRTRYPDNKRYAIVRGQVRPRLVLRQKQTWLSGYISDLSAGHINVPLDYHALFGTAGRERGDGARYTISVAFGKRLEPWILTATAQGAAD